MVLKKKACSSHSSGYCQTWHKLQLSIQRVSIVLEYQDMRLVSIFCFCKTKAHLFQFSETNQPNYDRLEMVATKFSYPTKFKCYLITQATEEIPNSGQSLAHHISNNIHEKKKNCACLLQCYHTWLCLPTTILGSVYLPYLYGI